MAKLLLINGFPHEARVLQLVDFIKIHFAKENVCKVWMDPYLESRAVAMFETRLDKKKISCLNGELTWDNNLITLDVVPTTRSIFVRTYDSCPQDKLRTLFLKGNKRTLFGIEKIDDNCYCLLFQEGWDAVLEICDKSWKCMDKTISVLPYFDCFRHSIEEQYEYLLQKSIESKRDAAPGCSKHILVDGLRNIQLPKFGREQNNNYKDTSIEEIHASSCKYSEKLKECIEKKTSTSVKTLIFFPHPFLPKLLILLNIKKALAQHGCIFHESLVSSLDFEITGKKKFLKNVSRLFHYEYVKLQDSSVRNDFLALGKVQNDFKKVISSLNVSAILISKDHLLTLHVCKDDNTEITFEQFVISLVTIRQSLSPPRDESFRTKEWIQFVQTFNETNSSVHIFPIQSMVQIVYLSQNSHEVELLFKRIDKKVQALSLTAGNEECLCQSTTQRNQFRKSTELKNPKDEENMAASVSLPSVSIDMRLYKAYTYAFQLPFLAKILMALDINSAVQEKYGLLTVEINDVEISASGPKHEVEELFKDMLEQEEIVIEQTLQQKRFKDEIVLSKHILLIQSSGHFVMFEKKQKVKLVVWVENEKKLTLGEYLTLLILARDCFPLPSKDSNNNKIWKKFKEDFRMAHPMCQIIVTQELNVILFSLLHDEQVIEILVDDIIGIISVLWNDRLFKGFKGKTYQNSALSSPPDTQLCMLPNDYHCELKSTNKEWDKVFYDDHDACSQIKKDDLVFDNKTDNIDRNESEKKVSEQFVSKFYWMFEDSSKLTGNRIIQRIDKKISDILEEAFLQENIHHINLNSGPFNKADFISMTLTVYDETRHLIRIEKYNNPPLVFFPDQWQDMNREKWKIFEIAPLEKEYAAFSKILDNELNTLSRNVEILKIERLQNERLFKHSIIKCFLMQERTSSTFLWQRMAPGATQFVCKYGFHQAFSLMLSEENSGKGIYFFKNPRSCLSSEDIKDHRIVCLLYCEVLIGKSVESKRGLSFPPLDKGGNLVYDSVVYEDAYIVFSSIQAYPFYSVQLRMS